jgi:hypothetical protein
MDSDDSDVVTGPSRAQKGKTRAIVSSDSESDQPPQSKQNQLPPGRAVQTNGPRVAFNAQSKAKGQAIISGLNDRSAAKNSEQLGLGRDGSASRGGTPIAGGGEEAMQVDGAQEEEEEEEEDFATGMAEKGGKKRKVGDVSRHDQSLRSSSSSSELCLLKLDVVYKPRLTSSNYISLLYRSANRWIIVAIVCMGSIVQPIMGRRTGRRKRGSASGRRRFDDAWSSAEVRPVPEALHQRVDC